MNLRGNSFVKFKRKNFTKDFLVKELKLCSVVI